MSDCAIQVEHLSKCYHIYETPRDRLKQYILPRLARIARQPARSYFREFWALQDVSFAINKGETVGIVGRNGSGKSTLLQLICGTLSPTTGTIRTDGRIGTLLELGSGFNPEFTGRENVYMNAAVLGFTREETDQRVDEIAAFADIGDFLEQPVKVYSSGMVVRLAFAVQAQLDPDILVVDEALAVGDVRFQAKCFARLQALRDKGATILFVSHSTEQIVTHCNRAALIGDGRLLEMGEPRHIVNRYLDLLFGRVRRETSDEQGLDTAEKTDGGPVASNLLDGADERFLDPTAADFQRRVPYNPHEYRWGDGAAEFLDFMLLDGNDEVVHGVKRGTRLRLLLKFHFWSEVIFPILGVTIKTREGVAVFGTNSEMLESSAIASLGVPRQVHYVVAQFSTELAAGDYFISVGLASRDGCSIVPHDRRYDSIHFVVESDNRFFGIANLAAEFELAASSVMVRDVDDGH